MDGPVTECPVDEFWRAIKLDLFGTFVCCKYGSPELIKAGGGAIVNMTSVVAITGMKNRDAYTAAKGGVASITRSIAVEYAKHNIRANAIAPCAIQTERVKKFLTGDPSVQAMIDKHLLGLGVPDDVVHTFTVMHQRNVPGFEDESPYINIIVELAEQPMLLMASTLPHSERPRVRIGALVEVYFEEREGGVVIPQFRIV